MPNFRGVWAASIALAAGFLVPPQGPAHAGPDDPRLPRPRISRSEPQPVDPAPSAAEAESSATPARSSPPARKPAAERSVKPLRPSGSESSVKPEPPSQESLSLDSLKFEELSIGEIKPAAPTAGRPAEVTFTGLTPPIDAPFVDGSSLGLAGDFLRRRVGLAVDNVDQPVAASLDRAELVGSRILVRGTLRLEWPKGGSSFGVYGLPGTSIQHVYLVDGVMRASLVKPVKSHIPLEPWRLAGFGLLFLLLPLALWATIWSRRRRMQLEAAEKSVPAAQSVPVGEDRADPLPAPSTPGSPAEEPAETDGRRETPLDRPVPQVPERLAKAVCAGQAVLVLGTGASAQAGLPTANSLMLGLVRQLDQQLPEALTYVLRQPDPTREFSRLKVELGGYSKVMDAILSAVPREEVIGAIHRELSGGGREGSRLHSLLARLPWRGVVAMTWDRLAERVFAAERPSALAPLQHFGPGDSAELASAMRAGAPLLLTPLGDLDKPHSLSLSMGELRRALVRSPELQRCLVALLQSHSFLFVGHAVDSVEAFLQAVAPELEVTDGRHYVLLPNERTNAVWATTLGRFGVEILPYEADSAHSGVVEFVANLSQCVEAGRSKHSEDPSALLPGILSAEPVTALRLTNIGPFDKLELEFAVNEEVPPEERPAAARPWTVIFGGNGIGKSSILRAMALVLAGSHPSARAAGRRLLKAGASDGLIEVQMGSHWLKTQLVRDRASVEVISAQQTPVQNGSALVLGFSALRGARAADPGGPSTTDETRDPDPLDLLPLIDGAVDGRLADFKQWLLNLLVRAEDPSQVRAVAMRDLLDKVIRDIVPGQIDALVPIDKKDFVIRVRTPEGDVPFDDLSQGMASIFNWIGVLAQRLFDICPNSEAPSREPAVVFIDEVDAHLHPEWQRRLVELTRDHFPNVQVIATSHSPLLAGALRGKELVVLRRDSETGKVGRLESSLDLFGMTSQHILTSAIFGMETDRNPEVERLVREYFSIFQKAERSKEEEGRLEALETEMARYRYGAALTPAVVPPEPSEEQIEALRKRFGTPGAQAIPAAEEPA